MVWKPTTKQTIMLASTARYILFGGSRGGGKTDSAIRWFLDYTQNPNFRGLVIRKNATDLTDFVERATLVWKHYGAIKTGKLAVFKFPNGAIIYTGHLADKNAYEKYQGHEYHKILIEELTHIPTQELFEKLMGSLRSTDKSLPPQFLATTNPGGAGHHWVKEYWHIGEVDYPPLKKFNDNGNTKIFIPANIDENPHLALKDPSYVRFLENLPADLREKWLKGNWDDIDTENQYYATRITKAEKDGRITNVPIEASLRTYASLDLGIKDKMALWIWQIHGREVRIVDYYDNRNQPLKHYSDYMYDFTKATGARIDTLYVPHDANVRSMTSDRLITRFEKMKELGHNVEFAPNIGRDDGIDEVRYLLDTCYFDKYRCKEGIRALRNYQREFDEKLNRYKDTPLHDWASDASDSFRYLALANKDIMSTTKSNIMQMQRTRR